MLDSSFSSLGIFLLVYVVNLNTLLTKDILQ